MALARQVETSEEQMRVDTLKFEGKLEASSRRTIWPSSRVATYLYLNRHRLHLAHENFLIAVHPGQRLPTLHLWLFSDVYSGRFLHSYLSKLPYVRHNGPIHRKAYRTAISLASFRLCVTCFRSHSIVGRPLELLRKIWEILTLSNRHKPLATGLVIEIHELGVVGWHN